MRKYLLAAATIVAGQAWSAAGAQNVQGAVGFTSAAQDASADRRGRNDDQVRGALFGMAQSGAATIEAASRKQRDSRRHEQYSYSGSAEGALLTGAGLLSPLGHLAPFCAAEDGTPSFDCQILKRRHQGR